MFGWHILSPKERLALLPEGVFLCWLHVAAVPMRQDSIKLKYDLHLHNDITSNKKRLLSGLWGDQCLSTNPSLPILCLHGQINTWAYRNSYLTGKWTQEENNTIFFLADKKRVQTTFCLTFYGSMLHVPEVNIVTTENDYNERRLERLCNFWMKSLNYRHLNNFA